MSGGEYDENAVIQRNTQSNYFGAIPYALRDSMFKECGRGK